MAVVTVFRSRLRVDAGDAFVELAAEMLELARSMPGFREFKRFTADDGERVSIIVFDSLETQEAWRDNAEHRAAQQRGRTSFYESYRIQVCEVLRERAFPP